MFEYWTHALAYVPTRDYRFYLPDMARQAGDAGALVRRGRAGDLRKVSRASAATARCDPRHRDDEPVEKDHPWASRKPTKRVLELAFFTGA